LFESKDKVYKEISIGRDIRRDDFISLFPKVKTVPHIIINGDEIGGFDKLTEWLNTDAGRNFLAE
jgi:glutaredoxin